MSLSVSALKADFEDWVELFANAESDSDAEFCRYCLIEAHKKYREEVKRLERLVRFANMGKSSKTIPLERVAAAKAVPIEQVLEKYGKVKLDKYGRGCCPFHKGATASALHKLPQGNRVYCHTCGKNWNPIDTLEDLLGMSFREAVEELT